MAPQPSHPQVALAQPLDGALRVTAIPRCGGPRIAVTSRQPSRPLFKPTALMRSSTDRVELLDTGLLGLACRSQASKLRLFMGSTRFGLTQSLRSLTPKGRAGEKGDPAESADMLLE